MRTQVTEPRIVNADPRYRKVTLIEPASLCYIHVAAAVQPGTRPLVTRGRERAVLLTKLKELSPQVEQLEAVMKVTVFRAILLAPPSSYLRKRADSLHVPRFDVVVLIETTSPATARQVQATPQYQAFVETLRSEAIDMHIVVARNTKRVGDVDKTRQGLFLFNYFGRG